MTQSWLGWFPSCWGRVGWRDAGMWRWARQEQNLLCLLSATSTRIVGPCLSELKWTFRFTGVLVCCRSMGVKASHSLVLLIPATLQGLYTKWLEMTNCEIIFKTPPLLSSNTTPHWTTHISPMFMSAKLLTQHSLAPRLDSLLLLLHQSTSSSPSSCRSPWLWSTTKPFCQSLFQSNADVYVTIVLSK